MVTHNPDLAKTYSTRIIELKDGMIISDSDDTEVLEEEKAIVTDIPGTTRDIVEGKIVLDGILLNIIDTAGIRETDNIVEQIGVNKNGVKKSTTASLTKYFTVWSISKFEFARICMRKY